MSDNAERQAPPDAPKCGYCDQPATTSNGNCREHYGRPPAGEWAEPDAWKRAEAEARERLAKFFWDYEIKLEKNPDAYAQWPGDSVRQPYCQWAYRQADALLRSGALAAYASKITAERDAWEHTAAEFARNADYYRGLVQRIGALYGEAAYVSDDGSKQQDILCAKVPELAEAAESQLAALRQRHQKELDHIRTVTEQEMEAAESQITALRQQLEELKHENQALKRVKYI